jgi:hypothetical protein|tara:strand:+ start:1629 stop:2150 length:522 start_codon:yes stop_codon:yes gene_type:complete
MSLARQLSRTSVTSQYFPFSGGLNIITPALSLEPGECIAANNFEVDIRGRYRRFDGYERDDGTGLPSAIVYYRIPYTLGSAKDSVFDSAYGIAFDLQIPRVGSTVKGETSGAIGQVLVVTVEEIVTDAGAFIDNDAEGYIYFTVTSGTLEDGETIFFLNTDSAFGAGFNVEYG